MAGRFDHEVSQLASILPDVNVDRIVSCLYDSTNMEQALDRLLSEEKLADAVNEMDRNFTPPVATSQAELNPSAVADATLGDIEKRQAVKVNIIGNLFNKVCNLMKGSPKAGSPKACSQPQPVSLTQLNELLTESSNLNIPSEIIVPLLQCNDSVSEKVTVQFVGAPRVGKTRLVNATIGCLLLPSLENTDFEVTAAPQDSTDCTISLSVQGLVRSCTFCLKTVPPAQQKSIVEKHINDLLENDIAGMYHFSNALSLCTQCIM